MLSRFERHQAASYGAAAVPSKTMCRQTLTTPNGPERHRRFYLAVPVGPVLASQIAPIVIGERRANLRPERPAVTIGIKARWRSTKSQRECRERRRLEAASHQLIR